MLSLEPILLTNGHEKHFNIVFTPFVDILIERGRRPRGRPLRRPGGLPGGLPGGFGAAAAEAGGPTAYGYARTSN